MISIERFSAGTEEAVWKIFRSAVRIGCVKDYSQEQLQAWAPDEIDLELWASRIKTLNPFVAKINGELVGYADIQSNGYIDHFYVHGEFQNIGVGGELMKVLLKNGTGLEKIFSHVSITARPFFETYGFIALKEQEVETRGLRLKNYLMERVVHSHF